MLRNQYHYSGSIAQDKKRGVLYFIRTFRLRQNHIAQNDRRI